MSPCDQNRNNFTGYYIEKHSVRSVSQDIIRDVCGPYALCFTLFTVIGIHSIRKRTHWNSETTWKVTEDSKLERKRNREVSDLLSALISKKSEEKVKLFKTRNWLMHHMKVILKILLKEHVSLENRYTLWWYCCQSW